MFLQRQRAARLAETETDDFIKDTPTPPQDQSGQWQETAGSLEWVQSENCTKNDNEKKEEEDEEIDLNKGMKEAFHQTDAVSKCHLFHNIVFFLELFHVSNTCLL